MPTVIKAFALFQRENSASNTSKLHIYGDGPERDRLAALCAENSLDPCDVLMGRTENPLQAMEEVDVVIVSSSFEGFGMVYLEAMALGKPIISSKIDTALEVLGNEGSAMFFETNSSIDLAHLMKNWKQFLPHSYRQLQKLRLEHFRADLMETRMNEVYGKMTQRKLAKD